MSQNPSGIESRALQLLGSGTSPEQTASALGVTPSRISQLISTPEFSAQVAELRFQNLQKHNLRDSTYDGMEDTLLEKLKDLIPLMYNPMQVLKAIAVINAAKRRGHSAPQEINATQTVVSISLPTTIVNTFITTNVKNQVVAAGTQELVTIQPKTLLDNLRRHESTAASSKQPDGVASIT